MLNWTLLSPRNVFVIAFMGILAYIAYTFAAKRLGAAA